MAHPYSDKKEETTGRKRAALFTGKKLTKKADGGALDSLPPYKSKAAEAQQEAIKAAGKKSGGRLDKYARGGKVKKGGKGKGNHVNIAIINPGSKSDGPDAGGALGALGGGAKPPMMPPPSLPVGAPGGMPPPALGGGSPGMPPKPPGMPGMMNRGGKVAMKGGADTGQGRLDKARAYGGKPLKGS